MMIYEYLLGRQHADMSWPEDSSCPINQVVQSNSTHVWFNLVVPTILVVPSIPGDVNGDGIVDAVDAALASLAYGYTSEDPEYDPNTDVNGDGVTDILDVIPITTHYELIVAPFMQILSQPWSSILNKDFCIAYGDWPGTWTNWKDYHDPAESPLDVAGYVMCGTGPFKLDYWTHGVEWSIVRFVDYWQGWPAPSCSRYLERATVKVVYDWGTRLADFRAGTADMVYIPRAYIAQVDGWPGIRGMKDLPTPSVDAMFFNFAVDPASPYVGSGTLDGNGIPLDFFSDIRIRKAFAHSFNWTTYISDVWHDEAEQPPSPNIRGLPYSEYVWDGGFLTNGTYLPPVPKYYLNVTKAAELFQEASADPTSPAFGVWTTGFKMTITYNPGNVARETAASIIETNVEKVFTDFGGGPVDISVLGVTWPTYLSELWFYPSFKSIMPLLIMGWLADFADPHDFTKPFMHSEGTFAYPSSYSDPLADALIELGAATPYENYPGPPADPSLDIYNQRPAIYHKIAQLYYEDAPSVPLVQPFGRHWERDWVQGWYYNPLYGGSLSVGAGSTVPAGPVLYFYHLWKGIDADLNSDNAVNVMDYAILSQHMYDPPDVGPLGYDRIADIYPELAPDGLVNALDLALMYEQWGDTVSPVYSGASTSYPFENVREESSKFIEGQESSATEPTIYIDPEQTVNETLKTGTSFFIDINIANVTDLMGYDFRLTFNSSILNAVSVTVGDFFTDPHVWHTKINNNAGFVRFAVTPPLGTTLGWNGSGRLATIEFQVMGYGESLLEQKGFTKLGDPQGIEVVHITLDGYFSNKIPGDVNGDGIVDNFDLSRMGNAYGYKPNDPNWDSPCDINSDDIVDVFDLLIVGKNYGKTDP